MEVNKSVADMAANKFKNMLNRSDMKMIYNEDIIVLDCWFSFLESPLKNADF